VSGIILSCQNAALDNSVRQRFAAAFERFACLVLGRVRPVWESLLSGRAHCGVQAGVLGLTQGSHLGRASQEGNCTKVRS
jgi:hypothetical protein